MVRFSNYASSFINGELIGGSDIALEMYQSGELQEMISQAKSE